MLGNLHELHIDSRWHFAVSWTLIFLFYFCAQDPVYGACMHGALLKRIELGNLQGSHLRRRVLSEIAHRLMTLEACKTFGWSYAGIARQLRRHPAGDSETPRVPHSFRRNRSHRHSHLASEFPGHPLRRRSQSSSTVLLSGDALILAMMQSHGLTQLASNDADFDRIPGITRFGPV